MLELKDIGIVFNEGTPDRNEALKHVNLTINDGDFITVIGSNGSGKSTLFNIISGNLKATTGQIFLDGEEITNQKEYKRAEYIGRIFQNPLLGTAGKMTLKDNMMICNKKGWKGLKISLTKKKAEEFREELKKLEMDLETRLNDNVSQFSGGQRQALTLLMAVMSEPRILLLDEHTAALDPVNAAKIMKLTKQFAEEKKLTVLMITHNLQQVLEYGNRLLIMGNGSVIADINEEEKKKLKIEDLLEKQYV